LGSGIEFLGNGIEFLVSELNELKIRKESAFRRLGFICSNFLREPLVLSSSLTLTLLHWLFLPCFLLLGLCPERREQTSSSFSIVSNIYIYIWVVNPAPVPS